MPALGSGTECCPACEAVGTKVRDSRPMPYGRLRRRRCLTCGHRWSTVEIAAEDAQRAYAAEKVLLRTQAMIGRAVSSLQALQAGLAAEPLPGEDEPLPPEAAP